ncbi:MAG: hypothetical protein ABH878_05695 [bacterium]
MPPKTILTPAAALFLGVCFFLPWAKISCVGQTLHFTGAKLGGFFWILPVAAALIIAFFVLFAVKGTLHQARLPILICLLAALAGVIVQGIRLATAPKPLFGLVKPEHVNFRLQFGTFGTVVGYLLILWSIYHLKQKNSLTKEIEQKKTTGEN